MPGHAVPWIVSVELEFDPFSDWQPVHLPRNISNVKSWHLSVDVARIAETPQLRRRAVTTGSCGRKNRGVCVSEEQGTRRFVVDPWVSVNNEQYARIRIEQGLFCSSSPSSTINDFGLRFCKTERSIVNQLSTSH